MTRNQLPEGVGKKIVEALKKQANADITPVSSIEDSLTENTADKNTQSFQDNLNETFTAEINNTVSTFDVQKLKEENYTPNVVDKTFAVK